VRTSADATVQLKKHAHKDGQRIHRTRSRVFGQSITQYVYGSQKNPSMMSELIGSVEVILTVSDNRKPALGSPFFSYFFNAGDSHLLATICIPVVVYTICFLHSALASVSISISVSPSSFHASLDVPLNIKINEHMSTNILSNILYTIATHEHLTIIYRSLHDTDGYNTVMK
jgi:hypothetical protein